MLKQLKENLFLRRLFGRSAGPSRVDFLICGAQKGGTSALDAYLRRHPQVRMGREKELHFFDRAENFPADGAVDYARYHAAFAPAHGRKIWGESTPRYMFDPAAVERIHAYHPRVRLIAILREPVSRAYSQWNMECQNGAETRNFRAACEAELAGETTFGYLARGHYVEQIQRLWARFGRARVLVLRHEELRRDPSRVMQEVHRFIGVAPQELGPALEAHTREYSAPMAAEDREWVQAYFAPRIAELERVLAWDLSAWLGRGRG
jgi:hypothetical protein